MKQSPYLKPLLIITGITGITVGIGQLFFPVAFEASSGVYLANNTALLSEIRGAGGTLLIAGILIVAGVFKPHLTSYSLSLAILFLLSYGFSRIYGMLADGLPGLPLLLVTIFELGMGISLVFVFYRFVKK